MERGGLRAKAFRVLLLERGLIPRLEDTWEKFRDINREKNSVISVFEIPLAAK